MFSHNKTDKLVFVNIKNSYEAMQRNDTSNHFFRKSSMMGQEMEQTRKIEYYE